MVEFDSLDAATRARDNLNGADIYSGCCTLKIDYAKVCRIVPIFLLPFSKVIDGEKTRKIIFYFIIFYSFFTI